MQYFIRCWARIPTVAITTPTSASLLRKGTARTPLLAARTRENDKRSKYAALASSEGFEFYPFVLESYGGWGEHARAVLSTIVGAGVLSCGASLPEMDALQHARRTIAIALVQGNARLINNALALSKRPASAPAPARAPLSVVRRRSLPSARAAAAPHHVPVVYLEQFPRADCLVQAHRDLGPRHWSDD